MKLYKFEEGEHAWEMSVPLADCPYAQRSGEAAEWRAGWHYAADCEAEAPAVREQTGDERLDDPRHGQASYLNRRTG